MTAPLDIIGLVLGFLGLAGLFPLLHTVLYRQLPRYKLEILQATLDETTTLLAASAREGYVPDDGFVVGMEARLQYLRDRMESFRASVLNAPGFYQQCVSALKGLSRHIEHTCRRVKIIRARIVLVSDGERQKARIRAHNYQDVILTQVSCVESKFDPEVLNCDSLKDSYVAEAFAESKQILMPAPVYLDQATFTLHQPLRQVSLPSVYYSPSPNVRSPSGTLAFAPQSIKVPTPTPPTLPTHLEGLTSPPSYSNLISGRVQTENRCLPSEGDPLLPPKGQCLILEDKSGDHASDTRLQALEEARKSLLFSVSVIDAMLKENAAKNILSSSSPHV
ncbi:hypothetical protein BXZ70DRAFT_1005968 [Cristinia sonorae]|uniref:Uncharacterized protein n=1 Tax=Cristinia sonorae TaxID=1940300 RepID=A0A8K0UT00_9AGAR|nr:hypothetical protein BXZ70DRAFT_1005968 [Cristinia sonorae]